MQIHCFYQPLNSAFYSSNGYRYLWYSLSTTKFNTQLAQECDFVLARSRENIFKTMHRRYLMLQRCHKINAQASLLGWRGCIYIGIMCQIWWISGVGCTFWTAVLQETSLIMKEITMHSTISFINDLQGWNKEPSTQINDHISAGCSFTTDCSKLERFG